MADCPWAGAVPRRDQQSRRGCSVPPAEAVGPRSPPGAAAQTLPRPQQLLRGRVPQSRSQALPPTRHFRFRGGEGCPWTPVRSPLSSHPSASQAARHPGPRCPHSHRNRRPGVREGFAAIPGGKGWGDERVSASQPCLTASPSIRLSGCPSASIALHTEPGVCLSPEHLLLCLSLPCPRVSSGCAFFSPFLFHLSLHPSDWKSVPADSGLDSGECPVVCGLLCYSILILCSLSLFTGKDLPLFTPTLWRTCTLLALSVHPVSMMVRIFLVLPTLSPQSGNW